MKKVPIYSISEFFKESKEHSFYANLLPIHLTEHQFVNSHHRHSSYVAVLFTKGSGEHIIDFDSYPVKRGHLFFLNPGQVHCWSLSSDVDGYVFFHTKEFYESQFLNSRIEDFPFFDFGQHVPLLSLEEVYIGPIETLFKEIVEEQLQELPHKNLKISSLLAVLYIDLSRLYKKEKQIGSTSSSYERAQHFQHLVERNYKKKKLAREYADLLHISARHLSRICAEILNMSTTEVIQNRVLLEAKRLLIHQGSSVQSIAEELGYDDYSYFIRLFKKHIGISPKEFQHKVEDK